MRRVIIFETVEVNSYRNRNGLKLPIININLSMIVKTDRNVFDSQPTPYNNIVIDVEFFQRQIRNVCTTNLVKSPNKNGK